MLGKGFFNVKPFNPNPYFDPVIVNLSGAQKFEDDTVFMPGRYKIEVAPGGSYWNILPVPTGPFMEYIETITVPFIVRAYCGGNGTADSVGINPYSGPFKVDGIQGRVPQAGISVNHIFGAGGGNGYQTDLYFYDTLIVGGGNCLGNGTLSSGLGSNIYGGAGSCLHLLPVGGVFGTDYIRAYHAVGNPSGSAYGGAAGAHIGKIISSGNDYATSGGNSPYGSGGAGRIAEDGTYSYTTGTGIGAGGQFVMVDGVRRYLNAGAYFNGSEWINTPSNFNDFSSDSSYIRITYLGPLV